MELVELLRLDFKKGVKLGLVLIKLKPGNSLDEVQLPENLDIVKILRSENDKHICLVKVRIPDEFKKLVKNFNLDLIWTTPTYWSRNKFVTSCIGDQPSLKKYLDFMKQFGEIKSVRYHKASYQEHDILSTLTDRQKEILILAKDNGYYEYPRKINTENLSKILGISKATTVEHLRKAEVRLISNILSGF
jgi:hypothetical protein